jgi:tRNA-dihydrouridine synthase B
MLSIGTLNLESRLVLGPMAGVTDLPFRLLNRSFGCELAFTEMISANSLIYKGKSTSKMLATTAEDRPLGTQILGRDSETVKRALERIPDDTFDVLDFNAACPVKKVVSRGEGAGLLKEPARLEEILRAIVKNTRIPVTVKIRTGWDEPSVNAVEVARRAEDAGVKGLFIHGRTRRQGYSGGVDYGVIREVKESLRIPLFASGDALTPALIGRLFNETGCDGVAVARGAFGNPWIFRETAEYLKHGQTPLRPDVRDIVETMKDHLSLSIGFHGEKAGVVHFRKFFAWYTRGIAVEELKYRAFRANTREEVVRLIDEVQKLE